MENEIIKVKIRGTEIALSCPEGKNYAEKIAEAVDTKIRDVMEEDKTASVLKASYIVAMDYCESEAKYRHIYNKMKKRIAESDEKIGKLSKATNEEEYLGEIASLEERLSDTEKRLSEKENECDLLKEDLETAKGYGQALADKEKEMEKLLEINATLESALHKAELSLAEKERILAKGYIEGEIKTDDEPIFEVDENQQPLFSDEPESDAYFDDDDDFDDALIPGYLDSDFSEDDGDDKSENPFGLDFND